VRSLTATWLEPFRANGRLNGPLLALFLGVNLIVLINACLHDPSVGYDAKWHLLYAQTLSRGLLPSPEDTLEFFCPPLPSLLPAALMALGVDLWWAAKCAQLFNVVLSIGLTFYLIKTAGLINPDRPFLKTASLALLGMLPVYYKAFVMVRGEPLVAFFAVLVVYEALRVFARDLPQARSAVPLGIAMGVLILSRQWGFFVVGAVVFYAAVLAAKFPETRRALLKAVAVRAV